MGLGAASRDTGRRPCSTFVHPLSCSTAHPPSPHRPADAPTCLAFHRSRVLSASSGRSIPCLTFSIPPGRLPSIGSPQSLRATADRHRSGYGRQGSSTLTSLHCAGLACRMNRRLHGKDISVHALYNMVASYGGPEGASAARAWSRIGERLAGSASHKVCLGSHPTPPGLQPS